MYFLGRLGDIKFLAAGGLANSIYYICCQGVVIGLAGSIDTLCGQAYGLGNYYMMGIYMNRGCIIFMILIIPFLLLMLFSNPILHLLAFDHNIIDLTANYLQALIPALIFFSQYEALNRFLQAQKQFSVPMVLTWVMLVVHPFICYYIAFYLQLGMIGIPYAISLTQIIQFILLIAIISVFKIGERDSWFFMNKNVFIITGWSLFIKLSIYSALILCFDWWACELLVIEASHLGILQLARYIIVSTNYNIIFEIPCGISMVVAPFVAICIGRLDVARAKAYTKSALIINFILVSIVAILIILFRNQISGFFTQDTVVLESMSVPMIISAINLFPDSIQTILSGVIRGLGQQQVILLPNFIMYYPILQPLAIILAFTFDFKIIGFLVAFTITITVALFYYIYILLSLNWDQIANQAYLRVQDEEENLVLDWRHTTTQTCLQSQEMEENLLLILSTRS